MSASGNTEGYPHSGNYGSLAMNGWTVSLDERNSSRYYSDSMITKQLIAKASASVRTQASTDSLVVEDVFDFDRPGNRSFTWNFSVENKLDEPISISLPVVLSGLQLGHRGQDGRIDLHDTQLYRLQADQRPGLPAAATPVPCQLPHTSFRSDTGASARHSVHNAWAPL